MINLIDVERRKSKVYNVTVSDKFLRVASIVRLHNTPNAHRAMLARIPEWRDPALCLTDLKVHGPEIHTANDFLPSV